MSGDEVRAPVLWQRPHAKIYSYNQELGGSYYQPMIDYVESKDRQGIFFERPSERIHLPLPSEQCMKKFGESKDFVSGTYNLDKCLVKAYKHQAKEINGATVHTQNLMLRGSKENTSLHPKLTATMLRDHYVKELHMIKARGPLYA